jgi:DNA-binding NtrC family response regulator
VPDGYRVFTLEGAKEGIEMLANNRVAVVIFDQQMPVMNGTEFLSRVRGLYSDPVRVMLTGHADLNSKTFAINRGGGYNFLIK